MKRSLLLLISALLILLCGIIFISCDDSDEPPADDGDAEEVEPEETVYTVTFTVDGAIYHIADIPSDGAVTFPEDPSKAGYTFSGWYSENDKVTEIPAGVTENRSLVARFEIITYTATFFIDGEVYNTVDFNIETVSIIPPELPSRAGYNGVWESCTLGLSNIEINAVYTPIVYTATFKADGATVAVKEFTIEDMSFEIPDIPEKLGYYGMWESYTLGLESITIKAVYTAGDYVVTFMNGDDVVGRVAFTIEDSSITEPSVPFKQCYSGAWESYTLSYENITVHSVYTLSHSSLTKVTRIEPKCNATGNIEYWSCSGCKKYFSDSAGTEEIANKSSVILQTVPCSFVECVCKWCGAKDHALTHHARIEPQCNQTGTLQYWSCSKCGKNFGDSSGNNVLGDLTIPTVPCSATASEPLLCRWCFNPMPNAYLITYKTNGGTVNGTDTYLAAKAYSPNFLLQQTLHINNGKAEFTRNGYQLIGYSTESTSDYSAYTSANSITGFSNLGGVCEVPRSTNRLTLYAVWAKETTAAALKTSTVTYNDIWYLDSSKSIMKPTTGIVITGYDASKNTGSKDTIVIPEVINGKPVIGIAANAFSNTAIKKVVVPKSVKKVENNAFSSCSNLKEVVFFDSLQYVYNGSFPSTVSTIVMNSTKLPTYAGSAEGSFCIKYERVRYYRNEKKIIVLSGSSTLNGLNSRQLEASFNNEYQIVNYGTNAANESVFFLEVISKYTTTGDLIVLAPEWTSGGMMGDTTIHWKMFRGNNQCYDIFREVDMSRYTNFWDAYVTCQIGKALYNSNKTAYGKYSDSDIAGLQVGKDYQHTSIGMNKYGDLLGSRAKRTYFANGTMLFGNNQMSTTRANNLNTVNAMIVAKGGTLLFSFGTADAQKVATNNSNWKSKTDAFTQHCASVLDFPVISNVGTYIMGENDYSENEAYQEIGNSEWHCTFYGANVRTVELTYDIKQYLIKKTDSWESYNTRESHRNKSAYKTYDANEWNTTN